MNSYHRPELLFIVAPSFSGSTLLTFLLAQHPQIATIGELKATRMGDVQRYQCSCGKPILDCAFWKDVETAVNAKGMDFSLDHFGTTYVKADLVTRRLLNTAVRGKIFECVRRALITVTPGARQHLNNMLRMNYELSQAICDLQGRPIFLDGSKSPTRLMHFMNSGLWNIRALFLTRDGRGVALSNKKHHGIAMREATRRWMQISHEIKRIRSAMADESYVSVSYECLCRSPATVLQTIGDQLGLEQSSFRTDSLNSASNHIIGNSMRLGSVAAIELDEKWRTALSESELSEFDDLAGELNQSLGYD